MYLCAIVCVWYVCACEYERACVYVCVCARRCCNLFTCVA
jgi:hypothetical protein